MDAGDHPRHADQQRSDKKPSAPFLTKHKHGKSQREIKGGVAGGKRGSSRVINKRRKFHQGEWPWAVMEKPDGFGDQASGQNCRQRQKGEPENSGLPFGHG